MSSTTSSSSPAANAATSAAAARTPRRSSLSNTVSSTPASTNTNTASSTPISSSTPPISGNNIRNNNSLPSSASSRTPSSKPVSSGVMPNLGAIPTLTFPPPPSQENLLASITAPLSDETSAFTGVAKSCLQLTQLVGTQSSTVVQDETTVASSSLLHEASLTELTLASVAALTGCCNTHKDRRCRLLAIQTLAIVARGMYGKMRASPFLYHMIRQHHGNNYSASANRLEEELSMDVPSTLITLALNDPDDGVSATAVESLGLLVLHNGSATSGTLVEDELLRDCLGILGARTPYAPSLRAVSEEDPAIPHLELSLRVLEQALTPTRLVQLVDRIAGYASTLLMLYTLPVLTAALIHSCKTSGSALYGLERSVFAKRWEEFNAQGLIDVVVTQLLLPLLSGGSSCVSGAVALSLVRLAQTCPNQAWVVPACWGAARCWQWDLTTHAGPAAASSNGFSMDLETKLAHLAYLVIAIRPLPISEKLGFLQTITSVLTTLPSTVGVASGVVSAGVHVELQSQAESSCATSRRSYRQIRKPTRLGLWAEIALSLILDGPPTASSSTEPSPSSSSTMTSGTTRVQALQTFLTTGAMGKILADKAAENAADGQQQASSLLTLYDEALLAFTTVAVETTKRFRVAPDGTMVLTEENNPSLLEWTQMAGVLLMAFAPCIHLSNSSSNSNPNIRSDDDMTLLTAGQASFVCLFQEFLFPSGFLNADSCVAVKLTATSFMPHLLWDQVVTASAFLAKLDEAEPNDEVEAMAAKVVEELVAREAKQGVSSHPLRMYLLTLAADHWVQGRIASVRKHYDDAAVIPPPSAKNGSTTIASPNTPVLRMPNGREIALALSPKHILAKLLETQPPLLPMDDPKKKQRDPVRKLAQDTVTTCVACIEGIALMACDWRRRFGASQETKHLVSIAVGLLQGKVDETPLDENMKSILGPICEAAVGRIQAFYENDGGGGDPNELAFPVSDLVAQNVKPRIRPLISAVRPSETAPRDKVIRCHLMQFCRQIVTARAEQAVYSLPVTDSVMSNARPTNYLRLSLPPLPESKDARLLGNFGRPLASWGTAVNMSSASSDAAALLTAYTPQRYVRHDGEEEYRLTLLLRAFNTTPIAFVEGLRLELGVVQKTHDVRDTEDPLSLEIIESLGGDIQTLAPQVSLVSSFALCRQEIKAGDYVTWYVSLDQTSFLSNSVLLPSIVFRNVAVEPLEVGAKWVGDKSSVAGDASTHTGGASKSGEDDFQVTTTDKGKSVKGEDSDTEFVTIPGDPLFLSPMIGLQPCPMVFFRDRWGDGTTFRLFWFNMACVAPLKIVPSSVEREISPIDKMVAEMSCLKERIVGVAKLWAFSTLYGSRVFCALAEPDQGKSFATDILHIRGDDKILLYALTGSKVARESLVAALCPGMSPES